MRYLVEKSLPAPLSSSDNDWGQDATTWLFLPNVLIVYVRINMPTQPHKTEPNLHVFFVYKNLFVTLQPLSFLPLEFVSVSTETV